MHDAGALRLLLDVVGEDRVMLGTDYPFPLGEVLIADTYPGKVVTEADFDKKLKSKIFWENAMDFLNLDGSKF